MARSALAAVLSVCFCTLPAAAQGPAEPPGEESPELRALRLAEEELFGARPTESASTQLGEPPAVVTSDAGPSTPARSEGPRDVSWLGGLAMPDIPVRWDDKVVRFLEFFRDDRRGQSFIRAWFSRERRYGPMIRSKLRAMGLPEDLLFVAMVESGFDPRARSYAGAVGMWQFVERTGEEYGLSRTHWVDERMDPMKSTEAGARYLSDLRRRFGNWELAMAAYNMGYGALLRAMRKFNTNDYWLLTRVESGLPFETTIYVAKIMACAIVGRNPERFGLTDLDGEALAPAQVEVPGGTPLSRIASAAEVDVDRIAELNPELRRQRVPPDHDTYRVFIPGTAREAFARNAARLRPRTAANRRYVLRFGEDLDELAHRFRTTETALRSLNEVPDGLVPRAGTTLLVPDVEPRDDAEDEAVPVAVPAERFSYPGRNRVFYRVTANDTAEGIARFFRVTVDELRRWNNVATDARLVRGMVLQLFVPPQVDLTRAVVLSERQVRVLVVGSEEFFEYHEGQQGRVRIRYRVQPGDTLSSIGERFGLGVGDLSRINRIARNSTLRAGHEIIVYADPSAAPAADRLAAAGAPPVEPAEEASAAVASADPAAEAEGESDHPEPADGTAAAAAEDPPTDSASASATDTPSAPDTAPPDPPSGDDDTD